MSEVIGVNEFVLRFANVNGTGSASANGMVAKCIFRMGVTIGPKNMFPSNIQGLPTWFEIRVSERGFTSRRGGVDLLVAMNRQTYEKDNKDVSVGGYILYDSTLSFPEKLRRKDITYLSLPLTELTRGDFKDARQRGLLQNMLYVGAIASLLQLDLEILQKLIEQQYQSKPKLIPLNQKAFEMGVQYAKVHLPNPLPFRVEKRDLMKDKILLEGNFAAGLGCLYAGATVCGWYPITPSTSVVDAFQRFCESYRRDPVTKKKNYAIIQAEDEISAMGIVLGASWNGARAFTATSGPGISLMTEFLGYAYYAEIPAVLFNIQRCGPSTGMPTRTQQADFLQCAYASHGDTVHALLFPRHPKECFEFAMLAFDLAERLQTPVIVMSDLEIGMNEFVSEPIEFDDNYQWDRGKVLDSKALQSLSKPFYRYFDHDGDNIPYRTLPGVDPKGSYFTRGSGHDKFGRYTEDSDLYQENFDRLKRKLYDNLSLLPKPIEVKANAVTKLALILVGSSLEASEEALWNVFTQHQLPVDMLIIRAFPFHKEVEIFCESHDSVIILEQNRDGQLRKLLLAELSLPPEKLKSLVFYDGLPLQAQAVEKGILQCFQ